MASPMTKDYNLTKCQHCGNLTNITDSSQVRWLKSQVITLKETLAFNEQKTARLHHSKNGQIQALHRMIGELWRLLPEDKREEAYAKQQNVRDTIKKIRKEMVSWKK